MWASRNQQKFTVRAEIMVLEAYQDSGGTWTIGAGHTHWGAEPTPVYGMTITFTEGVQIFVGDMENQERWLNSHLLAPVTQRQFDALFDLCFNRGIGTVSRSGIIELLAEGKVSQAADLIYKPGWFGSSWGASSAFGGDLNRRKGNRNVFLNSNYGTTSEYVPTRNKVNQSNYQVYWPNVDQYRSPEPVA